MRHVRLGQGFGLGVVVLAVGTEDGDLLPLSVCNLRLGLGLK